MPTITRDSIMSLEDYAKARQDFRAQVMSHKKNRKVSLGKNVTLIFEDELTQPKTPLQKSKLIQREKQDANVGLQAMSDLGCNNVVAASDEDGEQGP